MRIDTKIATSYPRYVPVDIDPRGRLRGQTKNITHIDEIGWFNGEIGTMYGMSIVTDSVRGPSRPHIIVDRKDFHGLPSRDTFYLIEPDYTKDLVGAFAKMRQEARV